MVRAGVVLDAERDDQAAQNRRANMKRNCSRNFIHLRLELNQARCIVSARYRDDVSRFIPSSVGVALPGSQPTGTLEGFNDK
jgi:hypothetical protein